MSGFTQFDYLLNAFEAASQSDKPAENSYAEKRQKLYAHVRELERKAALWDAINLMWSFPGKTLEEVLMMRADELRAEAEAGEGARREQ
jgi:hypothetical protein